jgi:hypothetical protein
VQSGETARVVTPRANGVSAAPRGSQSEVSTQGTSASGVRDVRTTAAGQAAAPSATPAVPQPIPAATPTAPQPAAAPATPKTKQPAAAVTSPPHTPAAARTDGAPSTRPANVAIDTPPDAGLSGSKDAGARSVTSSKPTPPEGAPDSVDKGGSGADPEALQQAVRAHSAQTKRCYEIAFHEDPSLSGTVTLRIKVDSNGRVIEADADGRTETLQKCLITQVREIKFPKPAALVSLTIPFRFERE